MNAKAASYPSQDLDKFVLRLPNGMRNKIAALAKSAGRSMNAEIIFRLCSGLVESAAPPATGNLLPAPAVAGQRVQIVVDGTGVVVTGVVVAAIPLGATAAPTTFDPQREPRTPCCEPDNQEFWAG